MKHTVGNWIAKPTGKNPIEVFASDVVVARVYAWNKNPGELEANANLIAAAPEMYEKLQEVLNYLTDQFGESVGTDEIENILKKARGES